MGCGGWGLFILDEGFVGWVLLVFGHWVFGFLDLVCVA